MLGKVIFICTILLALKCLNAQLYVHPEQVHVSYGEHVSELVVTWVTQNYTAPSVVEYTPHGTFPFKQRVNSTNPRKFTDGGPARRVIWIHKVTLTDLLPQQSYVYHVGGNLGWSNMFTFKTRPLGNSWSPKFVIYGDFGNSNAQSLSSLQEEAQLGHFDAVLHIGDFAYDMNDNNGLVGDEFMRQIEPIAAYVPYMTCPGNHEAAYNFSHYKSRFSMPGGDPLNMVYSFDVGPVHFVSISTEAYYPNENQTLENIIKQYRWLEQDLQKANQASQRKARPWIIALGHRPMYCSNQDGLYQHCNNKKNPMLIGTDPETRAWSLEDLFYKYGVDVHFYAHEHSYERLWPVYKWKVCNGSASAYHNPTGPVQIVTGSAGDREGQTHFDKVLYPWSAFHSDDYGYTRLNVLNTSHLYLEQVSIDKGGEVIDKMTLVKEKHGAGSYTCHDQGLKWQPTLIRL